MSSIKKTNLSIKISSETSSKDSSSSHDAGSSNFEKVGATKANVQTVVINPTDQSSADHSNTLSAVKSTSSKPSTKHSFNNIIKKQALKETIKPRHTKMIAMASGIGTGLLVATGSQIAAAGVGGTLISYCITGFMNILMFYSCSEIVVAFPTINYTQYGKKFIDPAAGFVVSWIYCVQWMTIIPLELITASMTIKYWTKSVSPSIFVTVFYFLVLGISIFGAKGYAEAEFIFNLCKITMLLGFIILGIILIVGKAGTQPSHFATNSDSNYYKNPGAFNTTNNVFKAMCSTMLASTFACGGVEFVALTIIEQDKSNISKSIRSIGCQVIQRMVIFILIPIAVIGFLVPYNSNELLGSGSDRTHASPFVVAVAAHGIKVIPSIINTVIVIAVLSVANSAVYSSSRTLTTLSLQGFAPKWFEQLDKSGRPRRALYVTAAVGLLSFMAEYKDQELIFNWLLSIGGLSSIFIWTLICVSHVRFRAAMKAQGCDLSQLGCVSPTGLIGSYVSIFINVFIVSASFWTSLWPLGNNGKTDVVTCLQVNLAVVIAIALYILYKTFTKTWLKLYLRAEDIDITSDRSIYYFDEVLQKKCVLERPTNDRDDKADLELAKTNEVE
ncbi:hypothetical protein ACO0QE_002443 [Hanseniaspora vineae]